VKNIVFDPKAFKEFNEWAIEDKKLYKKITAIAWDRNAKSDRFLMIRRGDHQF
jgi:Txe/YoeB family toxin of Txe-Axe toxin-antitoxin module